MSPNQQQGSSLFNINCQQPAVQTQSQNILLNLLTILLKKILTESVNKIEAVEPETTDSTTDTQPAETATTEKFVNRYTKYANYVDPRSLGYTIEKMDTDKDGYVTDDEFKTYKDSGKWILTTGEYEQLKDPKKDGKNTEAGMAFVEANYDLLKQSTSIRKQEKPNTPGFTRNLAGDGNWWVSTDGIEKMNAKYQKMFEEDAIHSKRLSEQTNEKYQLWLRENKSASRDEKDKAYTKIWKEVKLDLKKEFGW